MAIGIYDSGVGGLSIWRELQVRLKTRLIYFGDTAHVPYGEKGADELEGYFWNIMNFFRSRGCVGAVVACNTTSTLVLPRVKDKVEYPVLGIVEGAVEATLAAGNGSVGILATKATVESGVYQRALSEARPDWQVYAQSAPRLVPLVEGGQVEGKKAEEAVREYLEPLLAKGIDTLLLGCTHYPFLRDQLERAAGSGVRIVDPAPYIAQRAEAIWPQFSQGGEYLGSEFWVSAKPEAFRQTAQKLLGTEIKHVHFHEDVEEGK